TCRTRPSAAAEARRAGPPRRARRGGPHGEGHPGRGVCGRLRRSGGAQVRCSGLVVVEGAVLAGQCRVLVVFVDVVVHGPVHVVEQELRARLLELARFFEAPMASLLHGTAPEARRGEVNGHHSARGPGSCTPPPLPSRGMPTPSTPAPW